MSTVRVANAPLSYGAFEMTVGTSFPVPGPEQVLEAIAAAGYDGTDLGPPGYLGEGKLLAERVGASGLDVVGGFVPLHLSEPEHADVDAAELRRTLDLFAAAGATAAQPVLSDAGSPARAAAPGRGEEDPALRLEGARWRALADGVARAVAIARERGYEPVFHPHAGSYVEGPREIERLLDDTDVSLLLDTGHLALAGADPVRALRDWGPRIGAVHLKDVRADVLAAVRRERTDMLTAWRRGVFCALGDGDVDLAGVCRALAEAGYSGWVVVEQDRVLEDVAELAAAARDQERNRAWLDVHAGW
jgi:inosose dehydratase